MNSLDLDQLEMRNNNGPECCGHQDARLETPVATKVKLLRYLTYLHTSPQLVYPVIFKILL